MTQNNVKEKRMPGVNIQNKDRVFRMIFGYEKYKKLQHANERL